MRNLANLTIFLISCISAIASQSDSTANMSKNFHLSLGIRGAHYYHTNAYAPVHMPDYLSPIRENQPEISSNWGLDRTSCTGGQTASDNPLYHGAAYADFKFLISGYGFKVTADIIAEHRGISYGVFDRESMYFFPKINMKFDTTFRIFGEPFTAGVDVGNFDEVRLYEGLNFYNFDCMGSYFYLQWRNLRLAFNRYGDLDYGYGLNIGDSDDFIITVGDVCLSENWKLDLNLGFFNYAASCYDKYDKLNDHSGYTFSAAIHGHGLRAYGQYALRDMNDEYTDRKYRSALLFGAKYECDFGVIRLSTRADYRWFGFYFNKGFINEDVYFRDPEGGSYNNTIGDNFYPLYQYERPFGQWVVYTEYQSKNVSALELQLNARCYFYDRLMALLDLDYIYIRASGLDGFDYPFYNAGLGWEPIDGTYIMMSLTNKGMNLDKHYPTFYLYDEYSYFLSFVYDIDFVLK